MHMSDQFDAPGNAIFKPADHDGRLLLIKPLSQEVEVPTANGVKDAVRATVIVLDGDDAPTEHVDAMLYSKVLQGQIRRNIGTGRYNLGRLGQGMAKPGQKPPWKLTDPTDADKDTARAYLDRQESAPF